MKTEITLALLAGVMITLVGCSPPRATTPDQAILGLQEAIENGDEKAFLAYLDATGYERRVRKAQFQAHVASRTIEKKTIAAYGEEAAAVLPAAGLSYVLVDLEDAKPDEITITQNGGAATATLPSGAALDLVRKDDIWLVSVTEDGPISEADADQMVARLEAVAKVMKDFASKAGELSAEEYQEQYNAAFMQAALGGMPE